MLFEYTKCKKCNHLNPAYKNICSECKSYLRERVVNIDLWNTIQLIIEDPNKAFKQIIFSEHKNFIVFITFFIVIKNLLISRFLSVPELGINGVTTSFILSFVLMILITLVLSSSFVLIQMSLYTKKEIVLRFRDIYAVNSYSFIPYLFGLVFIFPVELVVLGGDIFTIIWSFFLIQKSILALSANRSYSIIITSAYFISWSAVLFFSSKIVFSI